MENGMDEAYDKGRRQRGEMAEFFVGKKLLKGNLHYVDICLTKILQVCSLSVSQGGKNQETIAK